MGQAPSSQSVHLETRVEDPTDGCPHGLALIAHGRLGGTFDQPQIRVLAEYLRDCRKLRVFTWNARGNGQSEGGSEWTDLGVWMGEAGVNDYNRMLRDSMTKFREDFPQVDKPQLFICGYSAGAIFAGCARPPLSLVPVFAPAHYILLSYPIELNPVIGLFKSGSYFRSLEALVQGDGWENLPPEFDGKEPEVSGVLTIMGGREKVLFYDTWTGILESKNKRGVLSQVVVDGAGHNWEGMTDRIVQEADKWLASVNST